MDWEVPDLLQAVTGTHTHTHTHIYIYIYIYIYIIVNYIIVYTIFMYEI